MMQPPAPIPLFVLTGFLGSGKTTLLNRLLHDPLMADSLVIINEFGDVGLDHLFIDVKDETTVLLSSGCLCCTIRGELVSTLEDILRDLDNHRMPAINRVIIETTGLADPAPVLQSVLGHPYISRRFQLQGVITLIDAINGRATLTAHKEALRQAAMADVLVISKTDLCTDQPDSLNALLQDLTRINPYARQLDAAKGEAGPASLLALHGFKVTGKDPRVSLWLDPHPHKHEHEHPHVHTHDVNHHDETIRAFSLINEQPIAASALEMFIDLLRSAHGPKLLRLKGLVQLAEDPTRPVLLHGVQHVFHPPERLAGWPDEDHRTRLVFITKDLDPSFVNRLWGALTGTPQIDHADRQALTDNPLSLRQF